MGHSKVGIVDYGVGNLRSVANAVHHIGSDLVVSSDPAVLGNCDHLILPGVGSFPHGISALAESRLDDFLRDYVASDRPCLGICLGMQLLMEYSTEFAKTTGLGFLPGSVEYLGSFAPGSEGHVRLPNVGWLPLKLIDTDEPMANRMFEGTTPDDKFYFVHSFAVGPDCRSAIAHSDYCGIPFTSVVANGQLVGTQFHPEKSRESGLKLLRNFINR